MQCESPLRGFQSKAGAPVSFGPPPGRAQVLELPCGQCVGCRLERSRQWAVRCMHEAQMHERSCFVTLTYKTVGPSLVPRDLQLFLKRLRREVGPVRFFACGEYGELNSRPHYHACIFGYRFADLKYWKLSGSGSKIYTSETLDRIWSHGLCSVGDVTFESAAYVARYVMKLELGKDKGPKREILNVETGEIMERVHEFCRMSLKPGIGYTWLERFSRDVYPHGCVIVNGVKAAPPKYYDKWYKALYPERFAALAARRVARADERFDDNSPRRLRDKAIVLKRKVGFLKREIL